MEEETTVGGYTVCEIGDAPDAFGGRYPGKLGNEVIDPAS